jgi:outer membrane immunogenic protein
MRISTLIISAAVASALTAGVGAADAADLPVRTYTKAPTVDNPIYNWSGFYVGGNVGGGWNRDSGAAGCINQAGVLNGGFCQVVPAGTINSSGMIGGGQIGYNWQVAPTWLLGLEGDIQGADIKGATTVNGPFAFAGGGLALPATQYTASEKLDWLGTVRGRVGATVGSVLLYATGGLAYGHAQLTTNLVSALPFTFPANGSVTKVGWTVGAGLEWGFAGNWSAKVEGLYYDLGTTTLATGPTVIGGPGVLGFIRSKDYDLHGAIGRVGLNYRFGGPVVAKY